MHNLRNWVLRTIAGESHRGLFGVAILAVSLFTAGSSFAQMLPQTDVETNTLGQLTNYNINGATDESTNAFFLPLGTNGRTCATCHQPAQAFGLSTTAINALYQSSNGTDPLFNPVDGANCIDSTSSSLLLNYGLIRIILPVSPTTITGAVPQWTISRITDPNNCQLSNPAFQAQCQALYGPSAQCVSVYRRPLPTMNLNSESTIMWDGREPLPEQVGLNASLTQQAQDAITMHEQGGTATSAELAQMVAFETGEFTTQTYDNSAQSLTALGGTESPQNLSALPFHYDENDNRGQQFNENSMTLFSAWSGINGSDPVSLARESIQRGEVVFNTVLFNVGAPNGKKASCSFCHNDPNVGNNSNSGPNMITRIGTDNPSNPILNPGKYLPTFFITCNATGVQTVTTDPGIALIDGTCDNIQKVKIPSLHGLAGRAPYFRNGSAKDLETVVKFYNGRFKIGMTTQQTKDLANFLGTL